MTANLRFPLMLSIGAAILTFVAKWLAYYFTGSVGLLSDALESIINLATALVATLAVWYASRPADADHRYGHEKIEFFSSGLVGGLIFAAAVGIGWASVERLIAPRELEGLGLGLGLSGGAALVNFLVARQLISAGREFGSVALEADGQHLMADVYTSAGVLAGLGLVSLTGLSWLDPLVALAVAGQVLWSGLSLMKRSFDGLMDASLPEAELQALRGAIREHLAPGMDYHALRTRRAGGRRFADFHLLVPGEMSVLEAHALVGRIEASVGAALPGIEVTVHVEPAEEAEAWEDSPLLALEQAERLRRGEVPMRGPPER